MDLYGMKAFAAADLLGNYSVEALTSYESMLTAASSKLWASWKACDLVACAVADTPYKLVRAGAAKPAKVPELENLLAVPNDAMTWWEIAYLTTMWLKLVGNAYWIKDSARKADGGKPLALIPVSPAYCTPVIDRPSGRVIGYMVRGIDGARVPFELTEVIHFKRPNPSCDTLGLGEIEAGTGPVTRALHGAKADEIAAKNGNVPPGVLVLEENFPTDEAEWKRVRDRWQTTYGGAKNAGKVAWLGGKWKHIQLGLSPREQLEAETRRATLEEIFHLHGVPLSVAGLRDAANYATAEIDLARFRSQTVAPMIRLIEEALNSDLVVTYKADVRIRFNLTGLINIGAVLTSILPAFDRGIVSPNEVRQMIGLERSANPIMDDHYFAGTYTPMDLAGMIPADPALGRQAQIPEEPDPAE